DAASRQGGRDSKARANPPFRGWGLRAFLAVSPASSARPPCGWRPFIPSAGFRNSSRTAFRSASAAADRTSKGRFDPRYLDLRGEALARATLARVTQLSPP